MIDPDKLRDELIKRYELYETKHSPLQKENMAYILFKCTFWLDVTTSDLFFYFLTLLMDKNYKGSFKRKSFHN